MAPRTELEAEALEARREAEARARQQEVVVRLGLSAIRSNGVQPVLEEAVRAAVDTLDVGFAKVLELEPGGEHFLLRAGLGWKEGLVGSAQVPVGETQGG
ncbi:MAG TPA: hypothetical protein VLF66_18350 [Thermoanaerobaculia bacterium]|nr:hypothetical protein [Thermoanaerobaculia bacterium]